MAGKKAFLVVCSLLVIGCTGLLQTEKLEFGPPETVAKIADTRIRESSGLARSLEQDAFFTHNDSGDTARIFRFLLNGAEVEEIRVEGARAVDWEDMASATLDGNPYLFVGDIGDNAGIRDSIQVYRVQEPRRGARSVTVDQTYTIRYPNQKLNAECLMVHPKTGDIWIVTKSSRIPSRVYRLPRPDRSGTYTLEFQGEIRLGGVIRESRLVTGGAISPQGDFVVLRTYMAAYAFRPRAGFDRWFEERPIRIETNLEGQGEAIAFSPDGTKLLTTSEGSPMVVSAIPIGRSSLAN